MLLIVSEGNCGFDCYNFQRDGEYQKKSVEKKIFYLKKYFGNEFPFEILFFSTQGRSK